MQTLSIIILFLIFHTTSSGQLKKIEELKQNYNHDTLLKGGYQLKYKTENNLTAVFLRKGHRVMLVAENSKDLGFTDIVCDYKKYLLQIFSLSKDIYFLNLLNKSTGKIRNIPGAVFIDAIESKEVLLYVVADTPTMSNRMILYNTLTDNKEEFKFPADIFSEPYVANRIRLKNITSKILTIQYSTRLGIEEKTYSR